jgi:hypothetical protein
VSESESESDILVSESDFLVLDSVPSLSLKQSS